MSSAALVHCKVFQQFWEEHPALLYGLAVLLGCSWVLESHWMISVPILLIWFPACLQKKSSLHPRLLLAALIFVLAALYCTKHYHFPKLPPEGVRGTGVFEISSVSSSRTHFGTCWIYKGFLLTFNPENGDGEGVGRNIPVRLSLIATNDFQRPLAHYAYQIEGLLKENPNGVYHFTTDKTTPWLPIAKSWSLAELRAQAKSIVSQYIMRQMSHPQSGTFLAGIATGDFDDPLMAHDFGRFGLQHIMAISGFHFAIIASFLGLFFRLLMPKKRACLVLIFLLSTYFLFLGCGPSILRAWITIVIALGGYLLSRRAKGLNSLGVALIVVLIFDPLMLKSIGFQFSFATTAAILLLYSCCDTFMQHLFSKRPLSLTVHMNVLNQHGYCTLATIRQALSLTLAVNGVALPMMLFYFHKFPWMSLAYNLFFPFLVSISMFLLILGILCQALFPPLGYGIHYINDHFTSLMLNYTHHMPLSLDVLWRVEAFPAGSLILHLSLVFGLGICLRDFLRKRQDTLDLECV